MLCIWQKNSMDMWLYTSWCNDLQTLITAMPATTASNVLVSEITLQLVTVVTTSTKDHELYCDHENLLLGL